MPQLETKIVETIVDCDDIEYQMWEGSRFQVDKETATHYEGYDSSRCGTYWVSIPKERCKIVDQEEEKRKKEEQKKLIGQMLDEKYKDNPEWQARRKVSALAKELGVEIYFKKEWKF